MGISYPHWNKVLKNTPVGLVKEFSVATQQFFKDDEDWKRKFQWSPLQIVAEQGDFELFMFISEKTKKTKPIINYDSNVAHPLYMAAKKGREEICKVLIANSVVKNPSNINNRMTAFHFAAEKGLTDLCKLMIESVDNKNPASLNGCTPLHLAAEKGHLEIVRLIVDTGVDKNCLFKENRHCNGKTPLDLAEGTLISFAFYRLLCKDKTQLCARLSTDLMKLFASCFGIFFIIWGLMIILLFPVLANLIPPWQEFLKKNAGQVGGILSLGAFVCFVTAFFLNIILALILNIIIIFKKRETPKSHCASKRKKENHQFQKMISQITHSYTNMTISYQF